MIENLSVIDLGIAVATGAVKGIACYVVVYFALERWHEAKEQKKAATPRYRSVWRMKDSDI